LEYGYYLGQKKPKKNNKIELKIPTVDEMCIEKGYLKRLSAKSREKTSTPKVSSGELLGGYKSRRPKTPQRPKTQRPKSRKSKRT
jgi:hypothetical protein